MNLIMVKAARLFGITISLCVILSCTERSPNPINDNSTKGRVQNAILLTIEDKSYLPELSLSCKQLLDKFRCSSGEADDTIHITEFPLKNPIPNPIKSKISFHANQDYAFKNISFYLADPIDMHSNGYKNIERIRASSNGFLEFPSDYKSTGTAHIIFAIIEKQDGFDKFVWVIK